MSINLVSMQHLRTLIQLLQRGFSGRRISCDLQLSRNTVKLYSNRCNACAFTLEAAQQIDDANLSAIMYAD